MSFALYCVLFGIFVFFPETECRSLTWNEPLPTKVVQAVNPVQHFSSRRLQEGSINASLSWQFDFTDLKFTSLVISLGTTIIAGVDSSGPGTEPGFGNQYGIDWIPNQNFVRLIIFRVTFEHNGTFTCKVTAAPVRGFGSFEFESIVQVDVVAPPSNMTISRDLNVTAPANLTLNCSADGEPKPTITWTRLSDNTVVTMPLNIIGEKDKGSYRCTADNVVRKPLSRDVFVNVLVPPLVTLASKVFVGREQNAFLSCEVEGNPTPIISWSPCDGKTVPCVEQYLNISKVRTARANYTCTATNALGVDSATTLLLIGGKNIYLRLSVSEKCDNKDTIWEILQKELDKVFTNTQGYSGAGLIDVRCESLIFDVLLKFGIKVAEDDTISIIQSAIRGGKLGELSVNVSYIIGIPPVEQSTTAAPTRTTPKPDDNTGLIIGAVLGGLAFVALIVFIVWYVRKKKCSAETKEVSDNTVSAQGRKGKGQNGGDEAAYASTSMLPHSKRPVEKTNQGTVQALPMYAQVDKTKKTSNKGGAAQRQPGELNYAQVEHVTSGRSLPRKSSSEPIKPSNEEIVYADLV